MKKVFASVLMLGLAGCATYEPRPVQSARPVRVNEARTFQDAGLRQFLESNRVLGSWPRASWDFPALLLAAFYFHPDLDAARARWASASSSVATPNTSAGVYPQFISNPRTAPSPWFKDFKFDLPYETANQRGYRAVPAEALSMPARLDMAATAWQIRARLRVAFLQVQVAQEREMLLRKHADVLSEALLLMEAQGASSPQAALELAQTRLALTRARQAIQEAERMRADGRVQLASAIGIHAHTLDSIEILWEGLDQLPRDLNAGEARRQAAATRADLQAALAAYAGAQSALQFEIAKHDPNLRIGPGYEYDSIQQQWVLGSSATLPASHQAQSGIGSAVAGREKAAAHFAALQTRIIGDVDRAAAGYRAAVAQVVKSDAVVQNLIHRAKAAEATRSTGDKAELAVVRAQQELAAGVLAHVDALAQGHQALLALENALQSPLINPEIAETGPGRSTVQSLAP